ncbi:MAG: CvpA family protein [Hyphomicrobiales bacterium]|nr:CvpA family protein [Hyphomicrobiales bacterium]
MPFSWLDVILVVIMLLSGFLAMLRGLTREMLAIMSWALAALATLFLFPNYRDIARKYIQPDILADAALAGTIFIVVLIVASLVTIRLSDQILDSRVGALDRTLGFVFGLARGLILVVISYELVALIVERKDFPDWVQTAQSRRFIESTGDNIISLLPDNPASIFRSREPAPGAADERTDAGGDRGYATGERRGLDEAVGAATRPR